MTWKCAVCPFTARDRQTVEAHAEKHPWALLTVLDPKRVKPQELAVKWTPKKVKQPSWPPDEGNDEGFLGYG